MVVASPVVPVSGIATRIFAIFVIREPSLSIIQFRGTGFFVGPNGLFLTAQHVVDKQLEVGESFSILARDPALNEFVAYRILSTEKHQGGFDLAIGTTEFKNTGWFPINHRNLPMGQSFYTYGFPLTERQRGPEGYMHYTLNPRYFEGYMTREFMYEHPGYRETPTYELNFPAPEGLSGSPLLVPGSGAVAGVIYGNAESYTIADEREVVSGTEQLVTETRKVVQFGLAHVNPTLLDISSAATGGKTLGEWQP